MVLWEGGLQSVSFSPVAPTLPSQLPSDSGSGAKAAVAPAPANSSGVFASVRRGLAKGRLEDGVDWAQGESGPGPDSCSFPTFFFRRWIPACAAIRNPCARFP